MVCAMRKAGVLSILFVVALLAVAVIAEAQQQAKFRGKVGWLQGVTPPVISTLTDAFRQGLRQFGLR